MRVKSLNLHSHSLLYSQEFAKLMLQKFFTKKSFSSKFISRASFELCVHSVISYIKLDFVGVKIFRESEKSREKNSHGCVGAHMLTIENHCVCAFPNIRYVLSLLFTTIHAACLFIFTVYARDTAKNIFPSHCFDSQSLSLVTCIRYHEYDQG